MDFTFLCSRYFLQSAGAAAKQAKAEFQWSRWLSSAACPKIIASEGWGPWSLTWRSLFLVYMIAQFGHTSGGKGLNPSRRSLFNLWASKWKKDGKKTKRVLCPETVWSSRENLNKAGRVCAKGLKWKKKALCQIVFSRYRAGQDHRKERRTEWAARPLPPLTAGVQALVWRAGVPLSLRLSILCLENVLRCSLHHDPLTGIAPFY